MLNQTINVITSMHYHSIREGTAHKLAISYTQHLGISYSILYILMDHTGIDKVCLHQNLQ